MSMKSRTIIRSRKIRTITMSRKRRMIIRSRKSRTIIRNRKIRTIIRNRKIRTKKMKSVPAKSLAFKKCLILGILMAKQIFKQAFSI